METRLKRDWQLRGKEVWQNDGYQPDVLIRSRTRPFTIVAIEIQTKGDKVQEKIAKAAGANHRCVVIDGRRYDLKLPVSDVMAMLHEDLVVKLAQFQQDAKDNADERLKSMREVVIADRTTRDRSWREEYRERQRRRDKMAADNKARDDMAK